MPRLWCSRSCWRVCRPSVKLVSSTSSNLRSSAYSKGRPETKSTLSMAAPISTAICSSGDKCGRTFPFCCVTCFCIVRRLYHSSTTKCICRLVSIGAYQTVGTIVPCRQSLCCFFFRSPKATIPKDLPPRLNESIAPRFEKSCSHLSPHKRPQGSSSILYYEQSQQHRIIRAGAAVRLG